ncbi:putative LuxR family transcriptional regulator [Gordonia polyisoprenivorans NBRC 16320 = JCM 10675]|uniref:helix-turn-helix transcriptional regulator n=1 Tax=Gordonia polyisoprenivorans TaxID=84595 RepID=UPI00023AA142|nr:putative LuxR family transcriptional regulator [Gordonia polyisoprenivorans NBRC 16320 = JCM 10675]
MVRADYTAIHCASASRAAARIHQEVTIIPGTEEPPLHRRPQHDSRPHPHLDPRHRHLYAVNRPASRRPDLSRREVEVLVAWLRAESKQEAAKALFISVSTVSTHVARIRAKYEAVGRAANTKSALFARAIQDGYVSLDEW